MIQIIFETLSTFVLGALFGFGVAELHHEYTEDIKAIKARRSRE